MRCEKKGIDTRFIDGLFPEKGRKMSPLHHSTRWRDNAFDNGLYPDNPVLESVAQQISKKKWKPKYKRVQR